MHGIAAALLLAAITNPHATLVALQALAATIRAWATPDDPTPAELETSFAAAIDAGVDFSDGVSAQFAPGGRWDGQLPDRVAELVRLRLSRIAGGAVLVLALLFGGGQARAVDVNGLSGGIDWTASTGPVAGYEVQKRLGSGAWQAHMDVTGTQAPVSGAAGQTFAYRVRSFSAGKTQLSAWSQESDPITFRVPVTAPTKPTIRIECATGTATLLPTGEVVCQ